MTVAQLKVGEVVQSSRGVVGKVIGFVRDTVKIDWGGAVQHYTDDDLRVRCIERWSPPRCAKCDDRGRYYSVDDESNGMWVECSCR